MKHDHGRGQRSYHRQRRCAEYELSCATLLVMKRIHHGLKSSADHLAAGAGNEGVERRLARRLLERADRAVEHRELASAR